MTEAWHLSCDLEYLRREGGRKRGERDGGGGREGRREGERGEREGEGEGGKEGETEREGGSRVKGGWECMKEETLRGRKRERRREQ